MFDLFVIYGIGSAYQIRKNGSQTKGKKMAKTATGSKQGKEAFAVLMQWRSEGAPEWVTSYEAWNLTGGIVGKQRDAREFRLINVASTYTARKGSLKDYFAIKAGA